MKKNFTVIEVNVHMNEQPDNYSQLCIIPTVLLFRNDKWFGFSIMWLMFSLGVNFTQIEDGTN